MLYLLRLHFLGGIGQNQGESHALFAFAHILAAVDIEQSDIRHQRAGLADGILNLTAGDCFIADQGQIAFDRSVGADGLIVQFALHTAAQGFVIQLTQIDVLVFLFILGNLQLCIDLIGQLAEDAQPFALAPDRGCNAGMEPGSPGLPLIGEADAQGCSQCLQGYP